MIHTPRRRVAAAALTAAALAVPLSMPAFADEKSGPYRVETLSKKYVLPVQIAVDKKIWVTDGAKNTLNLLGRRAPLRYGIKGGDTAGVDQKKNGESLAWATTDGDQKRSHLVIERKGKDTVIAKLGRYEKRKNPDAVNSYGITAPSAACATEWKTIEKDAGPISYKGVVDTHAYAVAAGRHGSWYVADAAANAILKVDRYGKISTVAVLPPQPTAITAAAAKSAGLSEKSACIGQIYNFEPVPTDVEVGPRGTLYVSTLAGGAEAPGAGAPGSVYKVHPWKGDVTRLATGFAGATNVAVSPHGTVYVAEFFAGQISKISKGKGYPVQKLAGVLALEHENDHLYASTAQSPDKKTPGKILKLHYKH